MQRSYTDGEKSQEIEKSPVLNNKKTLEYYLEDIDFQYSVIENLGIELGLFDYASDNNIDMLAILLRNHNVKSQTSTGRLTRALSLHSDRPIVVVN